MQALVLFVGPIALFSHISISYIQMSPETKENQIEKTMENVVAAGLVWRFVGM